MNSQQGDINDYFKTKRDQYVVEIRKNKTIQTIAAKRAKLSEHISNKENEFIGNYSSQEITAMLSQAAAFFTNALKSGDYQELTRSVQQIRGILSRVEKAPGAELISTGVVPYIVDLIDPQYYQYEDLMVECCWTIANIASGDTKNVVFLLQTNSLSPRLINILSHTNVEVRENAAWALANIAGDSPAHRDILIQNELVSGINSCMANYASDETLTTNVMWLVLNLCREKPYPEYYEIAPLLPLLQSVLQKSNDTETLHHVLSTFYYLSDTDEIEQIEDILGLDALKNILELLQSEEPGLKSMALKVIGHFLAGDDSQVQYLITRGVIQALAPLLTDKRKQIKKSAVWAISNVLACNYNIIDQALSYKDGYVQTTLLNMVHNEDYEIAQECIFCLANICSGGSFEQMQKLVNEGLIELLVKALKEYKDVETIKICLQAIENLLEESKTAYGLVDSDKNPYMIKLGQCDGFNVIQEFQKHRDDEVYQIVDRLIENNFDYEK